MFTNQTILLISPQPWGEMHISKHHYAVELASRGNRVFFLNPPDTALPTTLQITPVEHIENLVTVTYRPTFPFKLRFHARPVFDFLMRRFIRRLGQQLPAFDLTWCFDFNLYSDLRAFGAPKSIYHPVDPVSYPYQIRPARSADLVLSVSQRILDHFTPIPTPKLLLGHGLSSPFDIELPAPPTTSPIRFGYAGNLLRPQIDHRAFTNIITAHPAVEFVFWGAHPGATGNLSGTSPELPVSVTEFCEFLAAAPNVTLRGPLSPDELAEEMRSVHGFLLAYQADGIATDNSNSHKILEYLSTGQVVVSYPIDHYKHQERSHLIQMTDSPSPIEFANLFTDTIQNLETYHESERRKHRREFAKQHTYRQHIMSISELLSS